MSGRQRAAGGGNSLKKKNNNCHSLPEIPPYQSIYPLKFQILSLLSKILILLKLWISNNGLTRVVGNWVPGWLHELVSGMPLRME